ncbi:MAG: P-loop NTPase [Rhizobiales bacterium]|nr:P-loop NTPase [Hyphomicrobiales bacterium]
MTMFSLLKRKKRSGRGAAYARPRWVDVAQIDTDDQPGKLRIDADKLEARGFITRDTIENNLGREFSLIKRRLFRRLDYFANNRNGKRERKDERCPLVLVTSSKPGEGKTFSACNLALSLALEEQVKVLLMDADLAKPSVPGVFGFAEGKSGLYDCLTDAKRSVWNEILRIAGMSLAVLPAGQALTSPAPLLGGDAMLRVLDEVSFASTPSISW